MSTIFDILMIGILWFLTSLPLFTMAASTTAAYYAMSKVVRNHTGYLTREFFRSFKQNFRQSLPLSLINLLVVLIFAVDFVYLWNQEGRLYGILFTILLGICFLYLCVVIYICPLLSRFEEDNLGLIKLAAVSAFHWLPITVGLLVLMGGMLIGIFLLPWSIVVFPGILMYILTYPMEHVMRRFMNEEAAAGMWFSQDQKEDPEE